MIKFRYWKETSVLFGEISRPIAEVVYINKEKKVREYPYIDSEADISLIPFSVGDYLGFEVEKNKIQYISEGGSVKIPVILKNLKMEIGDKEFEVRIAWCLVEEVPPLLDRKDIFDKFNVNFKEKEEVIEFDLVGD